MQFGPKNQRAKLLPCRLCQDLPFKQIDRMVKLVSAGVRYHSFFTGKMEDVIVIPAEVGMMEVGRLRRYKFDLSADQKRRIKAGVGSSGGFFGGESP